MADSIDALVHTVAVQIKSKIPSRKLQISEVRRISVLLLGELEKLNTT